MAYVARERQEKQSECEGSTLINGDQVERGVTATHAARLTTRFNVMYLFAGV